MTLNIREYDPTKKISEPGIYRMGINDYHSDCCDAPSVSSGDLVTICASGEEYWDQSYFNPHAEKPKHKPHLKLGNAAHAKIIDPKHWIEDYILRPAGHRSWRSEAAQDWRMIQERGGKIAITKEEVEIVDGMAQRLLDDPDAQAILSDGYPELSFFARYEDIWIKCRPDYMPVYDLAFEADYKTAAEVDVQSIERAIEKWKYHQKLANIAWVKRQLKADFPDLPPVTECAFALIFQKTKRPYGITTVNIEPHDIIQLASANAYAMDIAAKCFRGEMRWPGYTEGIHKFERNSWDRNALEHKIGSGIYPKVNDAMEITK